MAKLVSHGRSTGLTPVSALAFIGRALLVLGGVAIAPWAVSAVRGHSDYDQFVWAAAGLGLVFAGAFATVLVNAAKKSHSEKPNA
jgi:hypothetical protein